jgi:acyl-CoA thioester hydrolase
MFTHDTKLRVRYAETDRMGYAYYGNYLEYYEVARVETLRALGYRYRHLEEEEGIMMPVLEVHVRYRKPAFYDEMLTIRTHIKEMPASRFRFDYEVFNEQGELINEGYTVLVFAKKENGRPVRCPSVLQELLLPYFQNQVGIENKR